MKIEFADILTYIKQCEGSLVTFMIDSYVCNFEFIKFITQELKIDYKIEYDRYDIKNIDKKTVVFINVRNIPKVNNSIGNRSIMFRNLLGNENVILIAINEIYMTITPSSLYNREEIYQSNIVFLLKNEKLTIIKSRYTSTSESNIMNISNIIKVVRKIKLDIINKK